ncbi:major type 1 subunit fimbrin (pilin) [Rosenbergiella nectarea]|uniref:Major type 1 subunit fimbrin (Pilin) n=1 Tax=Rosenbergiella nectarea TaxID=988801 RepID=A0A1H9MAA7_9GAMM|nr:fimbrial protein [Rosenbergiella nectarea]SER20063.1 major type 1 subunit fimbrin (pilin) [Rosenbergiella nectarea]
MSALVNGTLCTSILLFVLGNSPVNAAAPSCKGSCDIQVKFTGRFELETCQISIDNRSANETVALPTVSSSSLQHAGDEAGSTSFLVILKKCPGAVTVGVHFISVASTQVDNATGNIKNSSVAGMSPETQLRLRNSAGVQMLLNDTTSIQDYIIPQGGGDVQYNFNVSYFAKTPVTPGKVSATAGIELIYK